MGVRKSCNKSRKNKDFFRLLYIVILVTFDRFLTLVYVLYVVCTCLEGTNKV